MLQIQTLALTFQTSPPHSITAFAHVTLTPPTPNSRTPSLFLHFLCLGSTNPRPPLFHFSPFLRPQYHNLIRVLETQSAQFLQILTTRPTSTDLRLPYIYRVGVEVYKGRGGCADDVAVAGGAVGSAGCRVQG